MVVISFTVIATGATQDDQSLPESQAPPVSAASGDNKNELEQLGETLKAAVLSGTLSEEDAIRIYESLGRNLDPDNEKKTTRADEDYDGPYASKLDIMKLSAQNPGQITTLFQPEFLRRDLRQFRRDLDLDRDQLAIIEILLNDYLEAFELASSSVREAIDRYLRTSADQRVSDALQQARIDELDIAVSNTRDALRQLESESEEKNTNGNTPPDRSVETQEKRAARIAWAKRMIEVTATMEERITELRERVQIRVSQGEHAESTVTIDDLVRMAHELRRARAQLRAEFTESLGLITIIEQTDAEQARFNTALARVRIEHDLIHGRLGGESMNLWTALIETTRAGGSRRGRGVELDNVKMRLDERVPALAETLDVRTEAAIEREIRGLDYLATRDRINASTGDPTRLSNALRPFVDASRRELAASVAVRDELRTLLDESSALIEAIYPEMAVSRAYREAALRRGFRTEMRRRFSERALKAALRLGDLDDDSRGELVALESDVAHSLRTLRADSIARRIQRDPQRALQLIEAQLETESSRGEKFEIDEYLGFNHRAYIALDERIEYQLRAILTPEQFATLPIRPRAIKSGKAKATGKEKTRR